MAPLTKLVYLLALAAGLFFLHDVRVLAGVAAAQLLLWALWRVSPRHLARIARRMGFFVAVVLLVHGLTRSHGAPSEWRSVLGVDVNVRGLVEGVAMSLRVLALVLASTWVQRSGRPGDFGRAMIRARVPRGLAWSIEGTLTLLTAGGGGGGGGGRGDGSGGRAEKRPFTLAQLRRGDFGFLRDLVLSGVRRAERMVRDEHPDLPAERARDLALVSGIALAAMGLKMIQVMPGLPIAPGQKNLILLPFFLLASARTRTRLGGTWCGATVGLLSFFLGFGKWGILEVLHFVLPGLLCDLLLPLVRGGGVVKLLQLCVLGAVLGASRFAAQFLVILLAGGDLELFVVYSGMLLTQVGFGALSGIVSAFLLGAGDKLLAEDPAAAAPRPRGGGGGGGGRGDGGGRGRRARERCTDPAAPGENPDVKQAS